MLLIDEFWMFLTDGQPHGQSTLCSKLSLYQRNRYHGALWAPSRMLRALLYVSTSHRYRSLGNTVFDPRKGSERCFQRQKKVLVWQPYATLRTECPKSQEVL